MRAGQYKHKITFQQYIEGENENGFPTKDWVPILTVKAAIKTLRGYEFYEAATTNSESNSRFVIRYRKGITPDMRIKMIDNRIFDIIAPPINDDELNKTLTIHAREVK